MPAPGTVLPPNDVCQALARRLRSDTRGQVLFDAASRGRYATDASIYQIMPVGVFVPTCEQDIATALQIARELKVPVLPRGGGTSQCGQTTGAALVIDNSKHLRNILSVDPDAGTAEVEPGLVLDHLNARLKKLGLWYPVDVSTSAQATLGGMAGNNSCGSRSIAYGNMVHNVRGARAWMADGELLDFGPVAQATGRAARIAQFVHGLAQQHREDIHAHWPKVMRRVAGYNLDIFDNQSERPYTADGSVNLAHLLIGAEGTLAYTRSLTLQRAAARQGAGRGQLPHLPRGHGLGPAHREAGPHGRGAGGPHHDRAGPGQPGLQAHHRDRAHRPARRHLAGGIRRRRPRRAAGAAAPAGGADGRAGPARQRGGNAEEAAQKNLWEVRKAGLNIMMSLKGDGKPVSFIEDCAVPLQHLAEYTDALTEVFARHGSRGTWYAHASVGTLHVRPILDMRTDGAARMRAIAEEAAELVRKYKGAFSGEHGDGLCRGEWIAWQFGPAITEALRAIKQEFDPQGLFNPGKIIDTPRMDDGRLFRFAPADAPRPYRRIPITPVLDWSAWNVQADPVTEVTTAPGTGGDVTGGFAKAVEMCNNNGHCRKFDAGTMCPSYRVTRDEQHLTRGRANTLRLAISGQLGPDAFTSEAMHDTMDLCVGCKGCRRDCPTGVDMARMKVEFLTHYKARHGHTLKDRLVAHLPRYAATASRMPWLLNLRNRLPVLRQLGEKLLGLSARRSLPAWRSDTFWRAPEAHTFLDRDQALAARRPVSAWPCSSWTPSTAPSRAKTPWPPPACCRRPAMRCTPPASPPKRAAATTAAAAPTWPPAWSSRPRPAPVR